MPKVSKKQQAAKTTLPATPKDPAIIPLGRRTVAPPTPAPELAAPALATVLIEAPFDPDATLIDWCAHLDIKLTREQTNALRRLVHGLDRRQATLDNGRRVVSPADGVRYLLEAVAEAHAQHGAKRVRA